MTNATPPGFWSRSMGILGALVTVGAVVGAVGGLLSDNIGIGIMVGILVGSAVSIAVIIWIGERPGSSGGGHSHSD